MNISQSSKQEQVSFISNANKPSTINHYLDRRHHQTQERLKKLQEEKEKGEVKELQKKPKISKNSQMIIDRLMTSNTPNSNTQADVYDRLSSGKHNRKKKEDINLIENINNKNTSKPQINPVSQNLQRTIDDLYEWQEGVNIKKEKLEKNIERNERNISQSNVQGSKISKTNSKSNMVYYLSNCFLLIYI